MEPRTQYALTSDGVGIAYQVLGDGPFDLVVVPGLVSHLEHMWTEPTLAAGYRRLASFARVIRFDKRGTGMSDRDVGIPPLEVRMDDIRTVMDAAESERAAIFGTSEGAAVSLLFAASHPERTSALVVFGAVPRILEAPDWPGVPPEEWQARIDDSVERFGQGLPIETWAPSVAHLPGLQDWWATAERLASSPGAMRSLLEMNRDIDVRSVLPTIRVPTLVLHRSGDRIVPVAAGRYVASQIPGARFVALDGDDHLPYGDLEALYGEIQEFLTGERGQVEPDRVLATVVFTDIVSSTEMAAQLGDQAWRDLLDGHDDAANRCADHHRGHVVKSTGDGVLALFDGPARGARFAMELADRLRPLGLRIRAGVHTGEVERRGDDVGGIGVHIAARIAGLADPDEVLTSRTVKDLTAGAGLNFDDRGVHDLKGVPEAWQLYAVAG